MQGMPYINVTQLGILEKTHTISFAHRGEHCQGEYITHRALDNNRVELHTLNKMGEQDWWILPDTTMIMVHPLKHRGSVHSTTPTA